MFVEAGSLFVQKNLPEQGFLIRHGTQRVINSEILCKIVCANVFF